jgi:hypothetical protein
VCTSFQFKKVVQSLTAFSFPFTKIISVVSVSS